MMVVSLQGRGFLLRLQILSNPIGEPLTESTADLGEKRAVVVEKECVDGDEARIPPTILPNAVLQGLRV
jgi:hypothetical protein